ncbi:MAG: hypothetical protein AMXMBFR64_07510 [Myxococcales bacterium]
MGSRRKGAAQPGGAPERVADAGLATFRARPVALHHSRHVLPSRGAALQQELRVRRCLVSGVGVEEPAADDLRQALYGGRSAAPRPPPVPVPARG